MSSALGRSGTIGRRPDMSAAAAASHVRSKSRSQLYREQGAGESELDDDAPNGSPPSRPDGRLWSGHDLEIVCRQNSSIPAVLAYLQVGLVERHHMNGNGNGAVP